MEHSAPAIFVALEQSGFAVAVRQSRWLYPSANVGHILSLVAFAGALAVMDLRLLGAFSATAPGRVLARARLAAIAAFCGLAVTGFLLFSAEAGHVVRNPAFRLKVIMIAAALLNALIYEIGARRAVAKLPPGVPLPRTARASAVLSIVIWIAVAACGRSIAYF
ncbi:MAG: hypothetical protein JO328_00770 [Hyphomicrobiales bacterium]|nr:hypothetical protein [Hyphomicrobiales bacterium]MBV8824232.1 hypothetical protein [Hyphomicrobiales bacterium]MBV9429291.1 hypothetical protein [Bradyrhizobiaceae bacterium]